MALEENQDKRATRQFLSALQNRDPQPGANVSLTVDDILSAPATSREVAQTQVEQLTSALPTTIAPERIGFQNQFPGLTQGINVGQVSGQVIGSQPLFAAQTIFPFAVVDSRQRALQDAAAQRRQNIQQLQAKLKVPQGPAQFQNQIRSSFFGTVNPAFDDAVRDLGSVEAATEALLGPGALFNEHGRKFQEKLAVLSEMKDRAEFLDETSQNILKLEQKPEVFIPKAFRDTAVNAQQGLQNLESMVENPELFARTVGNLQTFDNVTNLIQTQILPRLEPSIRIAIEEMDDKQIQKLAGTADFDIFSQVVKTFVKEEDARTLARALFRDNNIPIFEGDEEATIDAITNQILSAAGEQIKNDPIIARKFNEGARLRISRGGKKKETDFLFTELSGRTESIRNNFFQIFNNPDLNDAQKGEAITNFIDGNPELRRLNDKELTELGLQFDRPLLAEIPLGDPSLAKEFPFSLQGASRFDKESGQFKKIEQTGRAQGAIEKVTFGFRDKQTGRFFSEAELKDNPSLLSGNRTEAALRIFMQDIVTDEFSILPPEVGRVFKDLPFQDAKGVPASFDAFFKGEQDPQRTFGEGAQAGEQQSESILLDISGGE